MATIKKESFGKLSDGREVELYTLCNTKGTEVKVTTYGARLVAWSAFGKDHQRTDIVLGYADGASYEKDDTSMGGLVGRHANRIAGGKVTIDGKTYQLDLNTGSHNQNHIHGGFQGFHQKLWTAEETDQGVKFTYHAADGEGGYPGNMTVHVLYSLSNDNELSIRYEAVSDADTVCNLTNHAYFNLNGFASGPCSTRKSRSLPTSTPGPMQNPCRTAASSMSPARRWTCASRRASANTSTMISMSSSWARVTTITGSSATRSRSSR